MKIIEAAKKGDVSDIEQLILAGANITEVDEDGRSALHWAAIGGHTDIVRMLVEDKGLSIDLKDKNGCTAFFESCYEEHWDTASICLKLGANPNCYAESTAPILMAAAFLQIDLIKVMITKGVDTTVQGRFDDNALHLAAMADTESPYINLELLKILYDAKTPIIENQDHMTPYDYLNNHDKSFGEMFHEYVDPEYHSELLGM